MRTILRESKKRPRRISHYSYIAILVLALFVLLPAYFLTQKYVFVSTAPSAEFVSSYATSSDFINVLLIAAGVIGALLVFYFSISRNRERPISKRPIRK